MVSWPRRERLEWLKRSVESYLWQDFKETELLVLLNRAPKAEMRFAKTILSSFKDRRIRIEEVPDKLSLGALRNRSLQLARGRLACIWDDDDVSHPTRLSTQMQILEQGNHIGTYLQSSLHFFSHRRMIFWDDWTRFCGNGKKPDGVPSTLLFDLNTKARFKETGPYSQTSEDDHFFRQLRNHGSIGYGGADRPLYLYVCHGKNQFDELHHFMMARTFSVSHKFLKGKRAFCSRLIKEFGLSSMAVNFYPKL